MKFNLYYLGAALVTAGLLAGLSVTSLNAARVDSLDRSNSWPTGTDIITDAETGCEYIVITLSNRGQSAAITPRLNSAGQPICGGADK